MSYENPWRFNGEIFESSDIQDNFGFVYLISCNKTDRKYWGRKYFWAFRTRRPSYKLAIAESDWKKYWGSNKPLLELLKTEPKENFTREILMVAPSKKLLTYYETQALFIHRVLEEPDLYFNDNILGKFYRKDFDI